MRLVRRVLLLALVAFASNASASSTLPIYIEDNHGGSFYWLAQHLDLDEPCTLLQIDAHSDASGVFDSDKIRARLRRIASIEERSELLRNWRTHGAVQCFNWIEPLMPAPIARVIWIPRTHVSAAQRETLAREAGDFVDAHLEAAPRKCDALRTNWRVAGLDEVMSESIDGPLVVSIDLDYFAAVANEARAAAFERVWNFVAQSRNLRAVTFAISRPYLHGDDEADALLHLALKGALSLPTAQIEFAASAKVANDASLRAREYSRAGKDVPAFRLTNASQPLRALLLANAHRISLDEDSRRVLDAWRADAPQFEVTIEDHQPSTDGIWRIPADEAPELRLRTTPWDAAIGEVDWIIEQPQFLRCNLTATSADEPGFAQAAPPRPRWREVTLAKHGPVLPGEALRPFFDRETGCGSVRLKARVAGETYVRETPAIEIRRFRGSGFRAALLEQFGLPYLFGSGGLRDGAETGPETGWGADCANFLVYALHRQGLRVPWSNPKQLRGYLEPLREAITLESQARFTSEELERGLVIHLASHVAALVEDRAPVGVLDGNDIVVHQLEGVPEFISLGAILQKRAANTFDLLRVPLFQATKDFIIGGDAMLGRSVAPRIEAGDNPFSALSEVLKGPTHAILNLECVIGNEGRATPKKHVFRAPAAAGEMLREAGWNVIGVANNHANDFGPAALRDSVARLERSGLAVVGTPQNSVHFFATRSGIRVAVLAFDDTSSLDLAVAAAAIEQAREEAAFVVALVHWGEENTAIVTGRQRELARWLINRGVDLIAGSHPHCIQPLDFYHGRAIIYSLGNLVFDGAPTLRSWTTSELLEVALSKDGASSLRLVPLELDRRGFPHAKAAPGTAQR